MLSLESWQGRAAGSPEWLLAERGGRRKVEPDDVEGRPFGFGTLPGRRGEHPPPIPEC